MKPVNPPTGEDTEVSRCLTQAACRLARELEQLQFGPPVTCVYSPLTYAGEVYALYVRRFATTRKRVVFLGMNPGPFGMVQTGVPFGEVRAVRDWLQLAGPVTQPPREHPRRPVLGFACPRSEISGCRLWRLFADRFGTPDIFFAEHFVLNYCPLAFVENTGRNRTPEKLAGPERVALHKACDAHLRTAVAALEPEWVVGIGDFAFRRAEAVFPRGAPKLGRILHPSPANPAANRDWSATATRQLVQLGVWLD